ncbi:hypothetical protein [Heyndrickxia ginsengihumi]|uniref:Uncharacterized protein n=1 Tax=Heyndrickxia ginsengihumi TaxID=363870 RepID=A0A0A6VDV7_9BACI|nr:hypothetical protein [Heyndrickxia ginsengihumi]KHD84729.1 hypothetical protein NG54_13530 [Heyndrickxia ginsengihumi]MBE6184487.1 hypothetical protein [Bacillus sp. (in: firmicutes)]MCM3023528.1 hypothetical protein [Heyndrickxia ginsengihumi]NEY20317.1 hypothetical protein [Heyndrickxia ginsengihumi]
MIVLLLSIFIFNWIAFTMNKRLTTNQTVHIWCFTNAFQMTFDLFVEFKYYGYWYFTKKIEWLGQLPHLLIVPPVNIIFLNWYPFRKKLRKRILYILLWSIGLICYELTVLLPEPFGYFHYGWWKIWYTVILDPILLVILVLFYKWICKIESNLRQSDGPE